jgi:hypothetical protein
LSLLSGVKRKSHFRAAKTGFDPERTSTATKRAFREVRKRIISIDLPQGR